ncbi:hypothetical protein B296_00038504 [Ensete ventricosum]|uniref:Uncharacterized protein n=1 Tax=Ensete ventricosum TaxID=4639 RepID=A0A426ZW85_ENSVE|nr:hypothetical protein B296_00038504 [Ensete ventricosum]
MLKSPRIEEAPLAELTNFVVFPPFLDSMPTNSWIDVFVRNVTHCIEETGDMAEQKERPGSSLTVGRLFHPCVHRDHQHANEALVPLNSQTADEGLKRRHHSRGVKAKARSWHRPLVPHGSGENGGRLRLLGDKQQ